MSLAATAKGAAYGIERRASSPADCPGYSASNVVTTNTGLTADLSLAGSPCNVYGSDIANLKLSVEYQTSSRLHVKIEDAAQQVYQVPTSVLGRPNGTSTASNSSVHFSYVASPFSFAVTRTGTNETLFNTSGSNLIFESQYVRLRTSLPDSPHLYGLGEHTDPFQLNTTNYTRTLWSRDAYGTPAGTNLYGNHPVYFDHRGAAGTHGVFLLSSSGMDIKINKTASEGQYLEYNAIGGIVDLYFVAGPSPTDVSKQYAEVVGLPTMQPYFGWGFHQCKYGYRDVYEVAAVVANYSAANIPLEVMWTDIDYMYLRRVFTLDPERYPLHLVRELVDHLHAHQQKYIVMVDPAVSYTNNSAFNAGVQEDIFMKNANGSVYKAVVWPGVAAYPDWFNNQTQSFWNDQFASFFDANTGVDIDALWIDMNEPSNFCVWPCQDPEGFARDNDDPPAPPPVRPNAGYTIPGFPADFQPGSSSKLQRSIRSRQASGSMAGVPGRDLINPPYHIQNDFGSISNKSMRTDLQHANGLYSYDTHNMYGSMMSEASRTAMEARRPGRRPLIITRSTFAGAGTSVGHWLGDNLADWFHYRISIAEMLEFAALFQIPTVGADVCGFSQYDTTDKLCSRWATLGAFYPFFRNHADYQVAPHEFYRFPMASDAAREAINRRLRLLDYIYTAYYKQTVDGTPHIKPLFFEYPEDEKTFPIDLQFFYGDAILVSPVTDDNSTSVTYYLPNDVYYNYFSWERVNQTGVDVTENDVPYTAIPLHIRGGNIIPMRVTSANTTTELRKLDFELVIAPGANGTASGDLYLDDGDSLVQNATSNIAFTYDGSMLKMDGCFDYDVGNVSISKISVLGSGKKSSLLPGTYNSTANYVVFDISPGIPLTRAYQVQLF